MYCSCDGTHDIWNIENVSKFRHVKLCKNHQHKIRALEVDDISDFLFKESLISTTEYGGTFFKLASLSDFSL